MGIGVSKGDGCEGAARGGCEAVGGMSDPPKRGDTSARGCAWGQVGQGLEAGLPGPPARHGSPTRRQGRRPTLAHRFGGELQSGECTRKWDLGQKRTSWATHVGIPVHFGVHRPVPVNISRKGRVPARKRPSMQNGASLSESVGCSVGAASERAIHGPRSPGVGGLW